MIKMQTENTIYSRLQCLVTGKLSKNKLLNKYSAVHIEL